MKQCLMICLFCLLSPLWGLSQISEFQEIWKMYGSPGATTEIARKIIATRDGGFAVCGIWQDSAFVMKLNACGHVEWRRNYVYGSKSELYSLCELPNGNFAATGYCVGCMSGAPLTSEKAWVLLTNNSGTIIKDTLLGVQNATQNRHARGRDIIVTTDGNLALTGVIEPSPFLDNVLFAKFNHSLTLLKFRQINHQQLNAGYSIVNTPNNGFAIGGASWIWNQAHYAHIFQCNSQGDTVWTQRSTLDSTSLNSLVYDAANGRLVAIGRQTMTDTMLRNDVFLIAVDANTGAMSAQNNYGNVGFDEGRQIVVTDSGYLVAAKYGILPNSGWAQERDWVFRLNNSFSMIDSLFYTPALNTHDMQSIVPLSADGQEFAFVTINRWWGSEINFMVMKRHRNGRQIQFTQMPIDYQLYPRNTADNMAQTQVVGNAIAGSNQYSKVRIQIFKNGNIVSQDSANLFYSGNLAPFNFSAPIHAELTNYHFEVKGFRNGAWYYEAEGCDVVAGDAYIIQGGKDAEGSLPWFSTEPTPNRIIDPRNDFVRNYRPNLTSDPVSIWHKEADDYRQFYMGNGGFNTGLWGLVLGEQIIENDSIPLAFLNGGVDDATLEYMLPSLGNHLNQTTSYGRFLRRVIDSGLQDSIRGIFFFQGESSTAWGIRDSLPSYTTKFRQLYDAWNMDFPNREHDFLFQIRKTNNPNLSSLSSLQIAEAQRQIADSFPNMEVMSTTAMNHNCVYFNYANGLERAGNDMYRLVDRALYAAPFADNIDAPNLDYAQFSGTANLEITLFLRDLNDVVTWYPGMEADFELHGSPSITVSSGFISGNEVHLLLSGVALPGTTISYNSHACDSLCSVKNANGIGLLRFYQQPILPYALTSVVADFQATQQGLDAAFLDASSSTCGSITSWAWTFGDGATSTLQNPIHTYSANGSYQVCLTITSSQGCQGSHCDLITIVNMGDSRPGFSLSMYPNPVLEDKLQIAINAEMSGTLEVALLAMDGKCINTYQLSYGSGSVSHTLDFKVGKGMYLLKTTNSEGQAKVFRVTKL